MGCCGERLGGEESNKGASCCSHCTRYGMIVLRESADTLLSVGFGARSFPQVKVTQRRVSEDIVCIKFEGFKSKCS